MSPPERVPPPPEVEPLVVKVQVYRNAGELLDVATQRLMHALGEVEVTDAVLVWAQTATAQNTSPDEYYVARWLLARMRGNAREQDRGNPC